MQPQQIGRMIGYARVSTEDQNLDLQIAALEEAGVAKKDIHTDKRSGTDDQRPGLQNALKGLFEGDTLVVWKVDRLARSIGQLCRIADHIDNRGANLKIISPPMDTTVPTGKLLFTILGAIAEFERALISERTKAGIARKRAMGQYKGRPLAITPAKWKKAHTLLQEGASLKDTAKQIGVSYETIRRFQDVLRLEPESPETKANKGE